MKSRFIMFKRSGMYYAEDMTTRKQFSLRTKDEAEALTILNAKNESFRQPTLNVQIARAYLTASDLAMTARTWPEQHVLHGLPSLWLAGWITNSLKTGESLDALKAVWRVGRTRQGRGDAGKIRASGFGT